MINISGTLYEELSAWLSVVFSAIAEGIVFVIQASMFGPGLIAANLFGNEWLYIFDVLILPLLLFAAQLLLCFLAKKKGTRLIPVYIVIYYLSATLQSLLYGGLESSIGFFLGATISLPCTAAVAVSWGIYYIYILLGGRKLPQQPKKSEDSSEGIITVSE